MKAIDRCRKRVKASRFKILDVQTLAYTPLRRGIRAYRDLAYYLRENGFRCINIRSANRMDSVIYHLQVPRIMAS